MQKMPQKDNSREVLALVLIGVGLLWLLRKTGVFYHFPFFHLNNAFDSVRNVFHGWGHVIFSWPMVLILIGLILMSGKRSAGLVLLIIGGIFILPKLFFISGAVITILLPLILIAFGIELVARLI